MMLYKGKEIIAPDDQLFKAIISGTTDDLKSFFKIDSKEYKTILEHENLHKNYLENSLELIKIIRSEIKNDTRKEFAIKTKIHLKEIKKSYLFGLLMMCHVNGFERKMLPSENKIDL